MKQNDFTQGPVLLPLLKFMLPVMFTLFLQTLYGAVDLWVVGRFSQPEEVAAVAAGSQMLQLVTEIIANLSLGTTVLLGSLLGRRRMRLAGKAISTTLLFFMGVALLLTTLLLFGASLFSHALEVPEAALPSTLSYVRICAAGLLFIVGYNVLGAIFRGTGNSMMPLYTVIIAAVCNIAGDLLLVAGFGLGAAGAAIATIASQGISVFLSYLLIRRAKLPIAIYKEDFHELDRALIGKMVSIGAPIAAQNILVGFSFLWIMSLVNPLGVAASAGIGIAEKMCGFIMLVPMSFLQSMSAFIAQNVGARKMDRANKALGYGIGVSLCFGIVLGGLAFFHGNILCSFFTREPEVIRDAAAYVKAYGIDTLMTSFLFCFFGYYNGCQKTRFVMVQGILGAIVFRVPLSWLLSRIQPVSIFRIGLANPLASIAQIMMCVAYFLHEKRRGFRDIV